MINLLKQWSFPLFIEETYMKLYRYKNINGEYSSLLTYRHKGKIYTDTFIYNHSIEKPCWNRTGHYERKPGYIMKMCNIVPFKKITSRKRINIFLNASDSIM